MTVAVRLLLALPHLVWLSILSLGALFVAVIGWFAALATGRLPAWCTDFLTLVIRYQTRVYAYVMLLTDAWPPLHLEATDYPVDMRVVGYPLNRAAVLFRIVLALPVYVVSGVASNGWFALSWLFWIICLVLGRSPAGIYEASCAVLRFQIRYQAYLLLLTPAYPSGLFGEQMPLPWLAPAPYGTPAPSAAGVYPDGTLRLSRTGRTWLILILIVGVIAVVGERFPSRQPAPIPGGSTTTSPPVRDLVCPGETPLKLLGCEWGADGGLRSCGSSSRLDRYHRGSGRSQPTTPTAAFQTTDRCASTSQHALLDGLDRPPDP
ncbi:MAG: DUF4389 domain-containing protein [Mycobacteriales bacterium]